MGKLLGNKVRYFTLLVACGLLLSGTRQAYASSPGNNYGISKVSAGIQREPKAAKKARLKQAAKDKKLKKDYEKFVKNNQKRSIEIQTPEVQARMKQNQKDANSQYKAKKKNNSTRTRKAGRKYAR
jgi:poly-D-alanine transfer protein DltD